MINEPGNITTIDALRALAAELDTAPHGRRSEIVKHFASVYGWSVPKVYRELRKVGWESGRKPRADKGTTAQCEDSLTELSAMLRLGVRKNGKATMHVPNARSLLATNGRPFKVGNARLNTLLRERHMDLASQKQDRPWQALRSLHPNHVHLTDPSLCILYYDRNGKQRMRRDDQIYKNKPGNVASFERQKLWRYVLVDHYSGAIILRYYAAAGETQANMYDYLLYCWRQRDGRVFHGVPDILYWDKGSANTAGAIQNALNALEVESIDHAVGNPRAKGAVEKANDLVECLFESRLQYEPVHGVDELNVAAEAWYNAFNADAIPHYDARLKRRYMREPKARYALWQVIRRENLRILPSEKVCRYLLSAEPVFRTVNADMTVSFKHPNTQQREWYDLTGLPGVHPKAKVRVSPLIYGDNEIVVTTTDYRDEEHRQVVPAIQRDEFAGFRAGGAIIGQEMKSKPDTPVETAGKAADRAAFPDRTDEEIAKARDNNEAPFGGLDAHSHLHDVEAPAFMERPGSEMTVPDRVDFIEKPLTHIEACKLLRLELDRKLTREENQQIRAWYPDGVPVNEVKSLAARLTAPTEGNVSHIKKGA